MKSSHQGTRERERQKRDRRERERGERGRLERDGSTNEREIERYRV